MPDTSAQGLWLLSHFQSPSLRRYLDCVYRAHYDDNHSITTSRPRVCPLSHSPPLHQPPQTSFLKPNHGTDIARPHFPLARLLFFLRSLPSGLIFARRGLGVGMRDIGRRGCRRCRRRRIHRIRLAMAPLSLITRREFESGGLGTQTRGGSFTFPSTQSGETAPGGAYQTTTAAGRHGCRIENRSGVAAVQGFVQSFYGRLEQSVDLVRPGHLQERAQRVRRAQGRSDRRQRRSVQEVQQQVYRWRHVWEIQ